MSTHVPRPRTAIAVCIALSVLLVSAASAEARLTLKGSKRGYTLVVPSNEVIRGKVTLTLPERAARHNAMVPFRITCNPSGIGQRALITLAATRDGQRTLRGSAYSLGLVPGDRCIVKRDSTRVRRITLH